MNDTNAVGARTEGAVMAALLRMGKTVLIPFGVHRYDLVFEDAKVFQRVQCKTGRVKDGVLIFNACSSHSRTRERTPYLEDADFFGVYEPDSGQCFLIPVRDTPVNDGKFRLTPARNNQTKGVKFAAPYKIN